MSDAQPEGETEAAGGAEPERAPAPKRRRRLPELRLPALLLGLPLVLFFFVPWDVDDPYVLPAPVAAPLLAMAVGGVAMVMLALAGEERRLRGVPIVGALLFGCGLWLLTTLLVTDVSLLPSSIRHLSRPALGLWIAIPIVAMGAEMAMHRHPESRRLTAFALLGWLALLALYVVPLDGMVAFSNTLARHMVGAFGRERFRMNTELLTACAVAMIAVVGAGQCALRLGSDRAAAAGKPFRRSWLAWALIVPPFALTVVASVLNVIDHPGRATKSFYRGFAIVGPVLGGVLAVRGLLVTEWARTRSLKVPLAVAAGLVAATVGGALYLAWFPRASVADAVVKARVTEIGEAVAAGLRGEPVERRFLGNYSSMDLRSAPGTVDLPDGARVVLSGLRVEVDGGRGAHIGYALVDEAGALGWVALDDNVVIAGRDPDELPEWMLDEGATPTRPTSWIRLPERFGAPGCRASPAELPANDALAAHLERARPACHHLQLRELGGPRYVDGSVRGYLVVFANDAGESVAVGGTLSVRDDGAWIGLPRPLASIPPPGSLEKWVDDIR